MKTEHRLAETLKELMAKVPLDDISVTVLTKKCHLNRQSFYYHFHDIYDLLTLVYLDEKIKNIDMVKNIDEMLKVIFKYYESNSHFVDASINSAGKELFQEFLYNNVNKCFLRFLTTMSKNKKLNINDKKLIARFYSLAYSYSIVYYLANTKTKSLKGIQSLFRFTNDETLEKAIDNIEEIRVKEGK